MEKTAHIKNISIPMKSTTASLIRYRAQFGRDAMADIHRLEKSVNNSSVTDDSAIDFILNFAWVFAKSANPEIPELEEWLDSIEEVSVFELVTGVAPVVMELLAGNMKSIKKSEKKTKATNRR